MRSSSTLAALYTAAFCTHICIGILLPAIPDYARDLGAPESQVGVIANAFSLSMALFLIPFGLLSDRVGHRRMLLLALVLFAPGSLLYILVDSPWQLGVVGAIRGLTCAAFIPAMAALLISLAPPGERGKTLGRFGMTTLLGVGIGPYLGGIIGDRWGFDAVFCVCAVVSALGLAAILSKSDALSQEPEDTCPQTESSWGWLKDRRGFYSLLVPFCLTVGSGVIYTYLGGYVEPFGIGKPGVGLIISVMYISSALSRAPAGSMSDRVGRKPVILLGLMVSVVSVACLPSLQSVAWLSVAALFYGVGMGMAMTPSAALLADVVPSGARARAMASLNSSLHAGLSVGPAVIGGLVIAGGYDVMFGTCALVLAGGLLLSLVLLRSPGDTNYK